MDIEQWSQNVALKQLDPCQRKKKLNQNYYKQIIHLNMKPEKIAEEYLYDPVLGKH